MRSPFVYTFIAVFGCSARLISSANAQHHGVGLSSSATASMSQSASGHPALSSSGGGPIGGYVPPQTPLPPLIAPNSKVAPLAVPASTTTTTPSASSSGRERVSVTHGQAMLPDKPEITSGSGRGTKVIFTPPPTIVGVTPSATGTGNIAGNNVAADQPFHGSILNTGLGSTTSQSSSSGAQTAASGRNPTPWIRITPVTYAAPTTGSH